MDRILIVLKKENGPRASSAPALGLNTIIFKYVYWDMKQISGERLQDHWSSGFKQPIQILFAVYFHVQFPSKASNLPSLCHGTLSNSQGLV